MAETKYFPVFDYVRMLAIFLVVLVHTQPFLSQQNFSLNNWTYYLIFFTGKLGVPLFVMISGALLLGKVETNKEFFKKRLKRIILPWIFWSSILFAFSTGHLLQFPLSVWILLKNWLIVFLSDYWFMPMILGLYLLTPLLRLIVGATSNYFYIFLVWLGLVSLLPAVFLGALFPGSSSSGLLNLTISFAGYYVLGFWLRQRPQQLLNTGWLVVCLISSAILYLVQANWAKNDPNHLFFLLQDYFSPPIVVASIASFILLLRSKIPWQLSLSMMQTRLLGKMTYGVFLSHLLIIRLLTQILPQTDTFSNNWRLTGEVSWVARAGLVYILSYLVIFGLRKIPYLEQLIT